MPNVALLNIFISLFLPELDLLVSEAPWIGMKLWLLCLFCFVFFLRFPFFIIYIQRNRQNKVTFIESLENKDLCNTASLLESFGECYLGQLHRHEIAFWA